MADSEQEGKQAIKWKLEAEEEYRRQLPRRIRIQAWLMKHFVCVLIGAIIGLVVGAGWEHVVNYKKDRATRSATQFESLRRINQGGIV